MIPKKLLIKKVLKPYQPSVDVHIEASYLFLQSKTGDWFLYEKQHKAKMGLKICILPFRKYKR